MPPNARGALAAWNLFGIGERGASHRMAMLKWDRAEAAVNFGREHFDLLVRTALERYLR